MPLPPEAASALTAAHVPLREDVPLRTKTWWRVGGPADGWVDATDVDTVVAVARVAAEHSLPVFVLGNASNLLVSDRGIRGITLRLGGDLARATELPAGPVGGRRVALGGGLKLVSLLKRAEERGWTGLELFAGIPGTVGGAVRMNAGTALGEVKDRLVDVDVVLADGARATLLAADLKLAYRHCELPTGAIVVEARFSLTDGDPEASRHAVAEHLAYRARTQPVDVPTCGSTFRNPPGDHAGRLIEAAGLKGRRIGGAEVSTKHANFLVNTGTATASDLLALIRTVQAEVQERFGVALVPEVHVAGEW